MKLKILFSFLFLSLLLTFQVNAQSVPMLTAPVNGSTWDTTTPTLYWYYYTSTSVSYTVQLSTDSGFGSFIIDTTVTGGSTANFAVGSSYGLVAGTTYHWRVSADGGSNWSTTSNFTPSSGYGGGTYTGGVPTLTAPVNGSTWETNSPTLYWWGGTAPYTVYLALDSGFTSGLFTDATGSNNYALSGLISGMTYYWKVSDASGESSTWSFTVTGSLPTYTITATAGANGSISPSGAVTVTHGGSQTFTITGDPNYAVDDVDVDAGSVGAVSSYTFTNVTADHTIDATFDFSPDYDWYVDDDAPGPTYNGTYTYPFLTIQEAIDAADANGSPDQTIYVFAGTYSEDLDIPSGLVGLELMGESTSNTTIKGSNNRVYTDFPATDPPNIKVMGAGTKLHNFTIENTGFVDGYYSSGIVIGATDVEVYDNIIKVSNSDDTDDISQGLQTYFGMDISGLYIHDNSFTHIATNVAGYEAIYINANSGSGDITIENNIIAGEVLRAITTEASNTTISGNSIITDLAAGLPGGYQGINISYAIGSGTVSDVIVSGNTVKGTTGSEGFLYGIVVGTAADNNTFTGISILENTITGNDVGVRVREDAGQVIINDNSIFSNTTYGVKNDDPSTTVVDAEDNWWGSSTGPTHASNPSGTGDAVTDYVDFDPWGTGTPTLSIDNETTVTGATFGVSVNANFYTLSADYTMQGKFYYNTSKLNFLNGTYSTGLMHDQLWGVVFYEVTPGIIDFIAYGISPLTNSGELFNLNFTVIDTIADTAQVVGNNAQFTADGSQLFGASGSFYGTVTYTVPSGTSTVLGDANLDFAVDLDDITLIALHMADPVTYPFTAQQTTNADVDTDLDVDADDIADIVYYIIYGSWPPVAPPAPSPSVVAINEATYEAEFLFLPVSLSDAENVRSLEMVVNYDENELDYQSFRELVSSSDYFVNVMKISDGVAKLTFASANGDDQITPAEIVMKKNVSELTSAITTSIKINGGDAEAGPSYYFSVTDIEDPDEGMPTEFSVDQNYPNPFNPTTTIRINLPETSFVSAKVYDMLGREVRSLLNDELSAGTHSIKWYSEDNYGRKVSSGAYIYRVIAGSNVVTKKMLLIK